MKPHWAVLFVAFVLLGGCAEPLPPPLEEPEALPPPRSNNAANNIGYSVVDDVTGRIPDSAWSRECVRQWTSAAYTYYDPPVVHGAPCLFYPTSNGTLFWQVLETDAEGRFGIAAAPIEREDGFFDWFIVEHHGNPEAGAEVSFVENGSTEPRFTWANLPIEVRDGPRAMRLADGSVHLMLEKAPEGAPGLPQPAAWLHLWADAKGMTHDESLLRGEGLHEPSLRGDGSTAVAIRGAIDEAKGAVYLTRGRGMETIPVVGQVFDATVDARGIHACLAQGPAYVYGFYPFGETLQSWTYEIIHASFAAPVAFTCDLALVDGTITVVTDTPAVDGGGPNPTGGSQAWTRDGSRWVQASLPFAFHSGDDLGSYGDRVLHVGSTGSGTTNGDPKCGTVMHMPAQGNPRNPWERVECNHAGDWQYVLDTKGAPLVGASAMLNPPYNYWTHNFEGTGMQVTSVVLALPPGLEPT